MKARAGLLVLCVACSGPSLSSNSSVQVDVSLPRAQFNLAETTQPLYLSLAFKASDGTKVTKIFNTSSDLALELPIGNLDVEGAYVVLPVNDTQGKICDGFDPAKREEKMKRHDRDKPGYLYVSRLTQSYTVKSDTSSLSLAFPVLDKASDAGVGILVTSDGSAPVANAKIVFADPVTTQPIPFPCDGLPFYEYADANGRAPILLPSISKGTMGVRINNTYFNLTISATDPSANFFKINLAKGTVVSSYSASSDFDGDGISDALELKNGTNPFWANVTISPQLNSNGGFLFVNQTSSDSSSNFQYYCKVKDVDTDFALCSGRNAPLKAGSYSIDVYAMDAQGYRVGETVTTSMKVISDTTVASDQASQNSSSGSTSASTSTDAQSQSNTASGPAPFRGAVDYGFGPYAGHNFVRPDTGNGIMAITNSSTVDTAGRILVCGATIDSNSGYTKKDAAVARFLPNGDLDASFGGGGVILFDNVGYNDECRKVLVDSSGDIFMVGNTEYSAFANAFVAKYSGNGAPITSFNVSHNFVLSALGGSVGRVTSAQWINSFILLGGNVDGQMVVATVDPSSGSISSFPISSSLASASIDVLTVEGSMGPIYVAGGYQMGSFVSRLNYGDYQPDSNFGSSGFVTFNPGSLYGMQRINGMARVNSNLLLVGEADQSSEGVGFVAAINTSIGQVETSFAQGGFLLFAESAYFQTAKSVLWDGARILVGVDSGKKQGQDGWLFAYDSNGVPDLSFGDGTGMSMVGTNGPSEIFVTPDDRYYYLADMWGSAPGYFGMGVGRLLANPTLSTH